MQDSKVKIYIATQKPTTLIRNDVFEPIQVGTTLMKEKLPEYLCDNDGENISDKNPYFCELTAQYWAWKNSSADYIGLFHYRRYLAFRNLKNHDADVWGFVAEQRITEQMTEKYGWTKESILHYINQYDIILPKARDITAMPMMGNNMREQFSKEGLLHAEDLEIMLEVLQEKYPEFIPYAREFLDGHTAYFNNMFVMKRKIFEQYSEWLFEILFECDKRINYENYSAEALRTPGHLAERLLNIYMLYLKEHSTYRFCELATIFIHDTEPAPELKPAFREKNVALVFSANDFYVPYLATTLASVRQNGSEKTNYDIIIMHTDISSNNQVKLKRVNEAKNCTVRFINVSRFEDQFQKLFLRGHFTIETWFRLLLPEILPDYDKVLYLDADLVADTDLAQLYETEVDGYLLAACRDADTAGLYNGYEPHKKEYMDKILKIESPYNYFQAGVILLNLAEFRKTFTTKEMLEFAARYDWELLDQDVLNKLAEGKVKFIDMTWNVMFDLSHLRIRDIIRRAPKELQDEYHKAHSAPKIIHYAGPEKPWHNLDADFAELFWKYAHESGYYEELLVRLMNTHKAQASMRQKIKGYAKKAFPEHTRRRMVVASSYHKAKKLLGKE